MKLPMVKIQIIIAPFALAAILWLNTNNTGGVDVPRYYEQLSNGLSYSLWELSNITSFYLIYLGVQIAQLLDTSDLSFVISILTLILYFSLNLGRTATAICALMLAYVSIPGILHSQNILRQFISLILILQVLNTKKPIPIVILSLLAISSHASAAFFLINIWITTKPKLMRRFFIVFLYIFVLLFFKNIGFIKYAGSAGLGDGQAEFYLTFLFCMLNFGALYVKIKTHNLNITQQQEQTVSFILYSMISIIFMLIIDINIWVLNRLLMGIAFLAIYCFFYYSWKKSTYKFNNMIYRSSDCLFFILNFCAIFVHPGAASMVRSLT